MKLTSIRRLNYIDENDIDSTSKRYRFLTRAIVVTAICSVAGIPTTGFAVKNTRDSIE